MTREEASQADDWEWETCGVWTGEHVFSLTHFPAEPAKVVEPNGVQWEQTMGRVVITYDLSAVACISSEEDVEVRLSNREIYVSIKSDNAEAHSTPISAINGNLREPVRKNGSFWTLIGDEDDNIEPSVQRLRVTLLKRFHKAWSGLWRDTSDVKWRPDPQLNRMFMGYINDIKFGGDVKRAEPPPPDLGDYTPVRLPHGNPLLKAITSEDEKLLKALCPSVHDLEEYDEHLEIYVHLRKSMLKDFEGRAPLEDIFGLEIEREQLITVFLRGAAPMPIFYCQLEETIVSEWTTWGFDMARKIDLLCSGTGDGFNPALRITCWKSPEGRRWWGNVSQRVLFAEDMRREPGPTTEAGSSSKLSYRAGTSLKGLSAETLLALRPKTETNSRQPARPMVIMEPALVPETLMTPRGAAVQTPPATVTQAEHIEEEQPRPQARPVWLTEETRHSTVPINMKAVIDMYTAFVTQGAKPQEARLKAYQAVKAAALNGADWAQAPSADASPASDMLPRITDTITGLPLSAAGMMVSSESSLMA